MTYTNLVEEFIQVLLAFATEDEAYKDIQRVSEKAKARGMTLRQVCDAYDDAERQVS